MELTEQAEANVTVVAVAGRLDATAARQLGDRLTTLIQSGRSHVLIDASGVDYVGSIGLRALLVATRLATEAKGRLVLCSLTGSVRRIIELGGFGDCLEGYASRGEALAKLSAG